jgi:hypothetical protein
MKIQGENISKFESILEDFKKNFPKTILVTLPVGKDFPLPRKFIHFNGDNSAVASEHFN